MKIGILFATHREAKPFLEGVSARPLQTCRIACYDAGPELGDACVAAVGGMGKVAAAIASGHLVTTFGSTTLISAGLCGLLHRQKGGKVGDLVRIHSAVEGDCDRFGEGERPVTCNTHWFTHMKSTRLVTCDRPVFTAAKRLTLVEKGDVVDMEGAAVARVCGALQVPCLELRCISNMVEDRDLSKWRLREACEKAGATAALLMEEVFV